MSFRKHYTDEDIINGAKEVKSIAGLCRFVGLKDVGGNFYTIKKHIQRLNIDTSHWTGQGWNKGQQLKDWSTYSRASQIKPHLITERGHACEWCCLSVWRDFPIPLELDHVDGDRTNNELTNLRLLCPNCHAQTPTWRGRNIQVENRWSKS